MVGRKTRRCCKGDGNDPTCCYLGCVEVPCNTPGAIEVPDCDPCDLDFCEVCEGGRPGDTLTGQALTEPDRVQEICLSEIEGMVITGSFDHTGPPEDGLYAFEASAGITTTSVIGNAAFRLFTIGGGINFAIDPTVSVGGRLNNFINGNLQEFSADLVGPLGGVGTVTTFTRVAVDFEVTVSNIRISTNPFSGLCEVRADVTGVGSALAEWDLFIFGLPDFLDQPAQSDTATFNETIENVLIATSACGNLPSAFLQTSSAGGFFPTNINPIQPNEGSVTLALGTRIESGPKCATPGPNPNP